MSLHLKEDIMKDKIRELLNDYFAGSGNETDKHMITEFIENYGSELFDILKADGHGSK
jgi:hypothetical protein